MPAWPGFAASNRATTFGGVAGLATLILAVLALPALSINIGDPKADSLAKTGEASRGLRALEQAGIGPGALTPFEVLVTNANPRTLARQLAAVRGVRGAVAPSDAAWHEAGTALVGALPIADRSFGAGRDTLHRAGGGPGSAGQRTQRRRRCGERGLHRRGVRQLPADDRLDRPGDVRASGAGLPLDPAAAQSGGPRAGLGGRRVGHHGVGVAGRLRVTGGMGHSSDRLDHELCAADGLRLPVRHFHGLRGVHPGS